MGSKVKCTCGWSWNKSDSSKKDMYICHECGRDNSNNMKNGGWLDNYNDYKVSAPEGMVGDGFSNVGRKYSPAWGGQFAMGGTIPGSVGFTYARTGDTPSEGPYAKKTLPSAQNGQEMQYYQEGLDWKPKTISKNGGWLNAYNNDVPKAQRGITQSKLDDIYQNDIAKQKFEGFKEFRDTLEGTDEVMYGTPEYEKAYKEGRFADVPNQLDEITISPYTKQFPYYEQLTPNEKKHLRKNINSNDPITRQLKARAVDGRGFDADKAKDFAMAYMRDIPFATLGAPQSVLVEGIEAIRGNEYNPLNAITPGSQRVPSETFLKDASPGWQLAGDMLIDVPLVGSAANAARKPIQKGLQQTGKYLTEETALRNAYKLNPYAFKPNPEAYYRGVGKEGIKDALESRVIKSRDQDLFPSPYFARPNEFKTALYYNPDALIEAKGIDVLQVKNIEPNQIIFKNKDAGAVPLNPEWVDEVYLGNITPGFKTSQLGHLPIDDPNIRLLQKDWLKGYEEVPKQNSVQPSFIKQDLSEGNNIKYSFTNNQGNNAPANKLWENLVNKGEAEKFVEGMSHTYKIKPLKQGGIIPKKKFKLKDPREEALTKKDNIQEFKPNDKLKPLTEAEKKARILAEQKERQGEIREHIPQSKLSRAKEIALNPLTAFGYSVRNESLPENFSRGERNAMDYAIDLVNPAYYAESAKNLAENQGQVFSDLSQGNFGDAALSQTMAGVEALNFIPLAKGAKPFVQKGMKQLGNIKTSVAPELRQGVNTNGFLDIFKSKPKSEINWGNWNKEIPNNPKLMKEYNAIEQTSKANGSWMKNPDGSIFQGTPEQFVQQNSANFKKSFPNGVEEFYRGNQHFNPNLDSGNHSGFDTHITFGTSDKGIAEKYATNGGFNLDELYKDVGKTPDFYHPDVNVPGKYTGYFNDVDAGIYHVGVDKNLEKKIVEGNNERWFNVEDPETLKWKRETDPSFRTEVEKGFEEKQIDKVTTDNIAGYISEKQIPLAKVKNLNDDLTQFGGRSSDVFMINPNLARPKSLRYNNGMFDMNNPNIYKAMLPIGLGFGAASQLEQKREGGVIKDDMGQWDHPGEITEIGSNQITMQGVPYPVLGISDEGDIKLMKPGKNYKFKGKKVTEFPMAKNGIRQEQKGLVNLNQLTNFTNYNKPTVGGWLNKYSS
jgi:hypothetical protein